MNISHFGLKRQYQILKEELLDATHAALSSGQLVDGPYTRQFENWLKKKTKSAYAITVHSGTQALEIIAKCEAEYSNCREFFNSDPVVLLPNISYPATLNAFLNAGYQVELCDTDSNGLIIIPDSESDCACTVGLYGADCPGEEYVGIKIVDGAQHWLIESDIGAGMAISFDPTKNLPSSGNGGAIVTNDKNIYESAMAYKNNGKPNFDLIGTNSKMSEQDCAQLLVRTNYIDMWQERRKQIRLYYLDRFENLPIRCLSRNFEQHADQKFVIYYEDRDSLFINLLNKNIEVKIHYERALSELPISKNLIKPTMLSTSVMLCRGVLSLPIYPELKDSEVEYIADSVCNYFMLS